MDSNEFVRLDEGLNQEQVISYLEDPHNDPFVLRDLLYSQENSKSIGETRLQNDKTFREIKSQLYDLQDLGVVEIRNHDLDRIEKSLGRPKMTVDSTYELTDEAHRFFYGKPYTLSWAYNLAQEIKSNETLQEELI